MNRQAYKSLSQRGLFQHSLETDKVLLKVWLKFVNILEYLYSINSNETRFNSFVDVVLIHCRQVFFAMNF